MVQDIVPGSGGSNPKYMVEINGITFLNATTEELGDELYAGVTTIVLPVSLLEFTGNRKDNDAVLNWKTTNEQNTSHFEIERSIDGRTFSKVGTVAAANTTGINRYGFTDKNFTALAVPVVYYRLKQVDNDGRYTYSRTIPLYIDDKNIVLFYPNPVKNEASLSIIVDKPQQLYCRIIDNSGRVMKQQQWELSAGSNSLSVDVTGLAKGMYYLELKGETINELKKFIKQ